MKIIRLEAENVKKLRAVEIRPTGEIVTIAGRNGQGKTSVLDAIWWALAGTSHIQAQPIRKGETKARIKLNLGEITVERRFTPHTSTLIVENSKGARFSSPQKMLDELLGELSFDPLAFARMEPRKQFDELRRVAQLDIDIDELDGLNKADYAKRTDLNRDAKAKRAQADALRVDPSLPTEPVSEKDILDMIESAAEKNGLIEQRKARRVKAESDVKTLTGSAKILREQIEQLRRQAVLLEQDADAQEARAAELQKALDEAAPLPNLVDVAHLRAQLDLAREKNRKIEALGRRREIVTAAEELEAQAQALTEQMEARESTKADAIARAAMPVPGLGFGPGVVLYQGVPFEQASSAEQLKVSLSIAMAANPRVRVIRIQDGSLLDEESLAHISTMAKEGDYQVWIEKVDTSGKLGVVIEDGAVVSVDGKAVEAKEAA